MIQTLDVIDLHPPPHHFRHDVLRGLSRRPRTIPPKYFYDRRGSELFERITELPEYYPTRTELRILERRAGDIAAFIGPEALLIEPGSGSSRKTRLLLEALGPGSMYMPIDISRSALAGATAPLREHLPDLVAQPVCADFTHPLTLPEPPVPVRRRAVFFPGSTLGNFHPPRRMRLLQSFAQMAGPGGCVVLGLDLTRDPATLKLAYDDPAGVTAAFNRNVLRRANAELGGDFDLDRFGHWAGYQACRSRLEMRLVSRDVQDVHVAGRTFSFTAGESILTECSYKFDLPTITAAAGRAGLALRRQFTDRLGRFAVLCLEVEDG